MLKMANIQTTLPAQDLSRARAFYATKLGLEPIEESPGGLTYECGGSRFLLFPSQGKASGTHTQIGFRVGDIESEVNELKRRGLTFEEYDFPGLKTVNSIATMPSNRAAWFKDSEGNLLGVIQLA
jgi:catechol 2,3-dioxygenase-like lactoylglutathione lyase family enzyme